MLTQHVRRIILCFLLAAGAVSAQSAPLAFEVATVKPSAPLDPAMLRGGKGHIGTRIDAARVDIGTATLFRLICTAYRLKPYQLSAPDWIKNATFDIQAKIPDGVGADKVPEMLQTLLVDRFGLKLHHDSKEQSVYALVVLPGGAKMEHSAPEPPAAPPAAGTPPPMEMAVPTIQGDVKLSRGEKGITVEMPGGEIAGKIRVTPPAPNNKGMPMRIHLESSGTTMKTFAEMLSVGVVDRPVVDKTGLTGAYEVAIDLSEDDAMNAAKAAVMNGPMGALVNIMPPPGLSDPSGSALSSSLRNLGLKLEPTRLPLDLLVVDHIEKTPTEN